MSDKENRVLQFSYPYHMSFCNLLQVCVIITIDILEINHLRSKGMSRGAIIGLLIADLKSPVGVYKKVEALQFFPCFQNVIYCIIR